MLRWPDGAGTCVSGALIGAALFGQSSSHLLGVTTHARALRSARRRTARNINPAA